HYLKMMRSYADDPATLAAERGLPDEQRRGTKIQANGAAAHVELFLAYSLAYLEGESREDKCTSYLRAGDQARYLGWTPSASSVARPVVRPGWEALESQAADFFAQ